MKRILALLVITLASFNSVLADEVTTQSAEVTQTHTEEAAPAPAAEPAPEAAPAPAAADDEWESLDGDDSAPADESEEE